MIKRCVVCGNEFEGNIKKITCNDECAYKRRRETQRKYEIASKNLTLHKRTCVICQSPFETYHSNQITCGSSCSYKHSQKTSHKNKMYKNKEYTEFKTCVICKKDFKGRGSTCSDECKKEKLRKYNTEYVRQKRKKSK